MQANRLETLWINDQIDPTGRVHVHDVRSIGSARRAGDLLATVQVFIPGEDLPREGTFIVELKTRSEPSTIRSFLEHVDRDLDQPLLMSAPRIGERSGALLAERRISWLDASGNYHLRLGDSVLERTGLAERGRPTRSQRLAFAPKSARVVRLLLASPAREWRTTEIAQAVEIDPGHASRTLALLRDAGYVSRDKTWHVRQPDPLLQDWASSYRFDRHDSQSFFSLTPRVEARMSEIAKVASIVETDVAFTGASAAGIWGALSAGDDVVAYIRDPASRAAIVDALELAPETDAPNLRLLVPEDPGVFMPVEHNQGLPLASRPQIYLDLLSSSRGQSLAPDFLKRMPWHD